MQKTASRLLLRLPLLIISTLVFFSAPAQAENIRVTEATDYWYQFDTASQFSVRTYEVSGSWSDPMLWFYSSTGQLLAANDDWYGLQSHIQISVPAGLYRLRAGVCCGDPNAWRQGMQYELVSGDAPVPTTTTTSTLESTTTTEPPTTTTEAVTTTTEPLEPSTTTTRFEPTTTTVLETTTSSVVETTTTIETLPSSQSTNEETSTSSSTTTTAEEITTTSATTSTTTTVEETTTTSSSTPRPTVVPNTTPTRTTAETTTTTTTIVVPTTVSEYLDSTTTTEVATTVPISTTTTEPIPVAVAVAAEIINADLTTMNEEEVITLIENLDVGELTDQQKEQLAEKLSEAPTSVKEKFESEVDIYSGGFDSYVPVGSAVPVGTRRVIVAATGVLFAMPVSSASSSGKKNK